MDTTIDLSRKGRIHGVQYRRMLHYQEPLDFETAEQIVSLAEKISPQDVKPAMYEPMSRFQEPLSYDRAAEQVAEGQLKKRKQIKL